ncbi:hypothetical protein CR513_38304, partial [Mucuna pruriens]
LQILGALFLLPHFSELLPSDEIHTSKIKSLSWNLTNFQIWWVPLDLTIAIIYNKHHIFVLFSKGARRTLIVTWYNRTLNRLCIELDQYQGLKMCKADSIVYTGFVERGRIFKFLHSLNSKYGPTQV